MGQPNCGCPEQLKRGVLLVGHAKTKTSTSNNISTATPTSQNRVIHPGTASHPFQAASPASCDNDPSNPCPRGSSSPMIPYSSHSPSRPANPDSRPTDPFCSLTNGPPASPVDPLSNKRNPSQPRAPQLQSHRMICGWPRNARPRNGANYQTTPHPGSGRRKGGPGIVEQSGFPGETLAGRAVYIWSLRRDTRAHCPGAGMQNTRPGVRQSWGRGGVASHVE